MRLKFLKRPVLSRQGTMFDPGAGRPGGPAKTRFHPAFAQAALLVVILLSGCPSSLAKAQGPDKKDERPISPAISTTKRAIPAWAREAKWYWVVVPRFYNGNDDNDPPGTLPWPGPTGIGRSQTGEKGLHDKEAVSGKSTGPQFSLGGDLEGVGERLGYLKELGVNTLRISALYSAKDELGRSIVDLRHVHSSYGASNDDKTDMPREGLAPDSWGWTRSDRVFLDLIQQAHRDGFRVVIDAPFAHLGKDFWAWKDVARTGKDSPCASWYDGVDWGPPMRFADDSGDERPGPRFRREAGGLVRTLEEHFQHFARRWMDPNGDGDPSDGVDGWWAPDAHILPLGFWERWDRYVKQINPSAIIVGQPRDKSPRDSQIQPFDAVVDRTLQESLLKLLQGEDKDFTADRLLDALSNEYAQEGWEIHLATPTMLFWPEGPRALSALATGSRPVSPQQSHALLRLALVCQHTWPGAPLTLYGDELGMTGTGEDVYAPMAWPDSSSVKKGTPASVRGLGLDSLIQWLHLRRDMHPPFRDGRFRKVMADGDQRLFAYSRPLPCGEVIVVINHGPIKQRVEIPTGRPGKLIGVLIPHLRAPQRTASAHPTPRKGDPARIAPLSMNGMRQFADAQGRIRFWIGPMSARLVLALDDPPR